MFKNGMRPVHPGEVLREDYLKPMEMSANALAKQLHVPASRINDIVLERRGITADTALRLSRFFGGDAQSWLHLQPPYDLRPPPPDPRKLVDSFLKKRRVAFQECSKKIPFGESVTLKVSLTLEPTTGVAVNASVTDEHSGQPYAICAVNVLRRLNYQRYVGPKQFDDLELKL